MGNGLPLDDSHLYEDEIEEEAEPQSCPCEGREWINCVCQMDVCDRAFEGLVEILETPTPAGDDWTPVKINKVGAGKNGSDLLGENAEGKFLGHH